VVQAFELWRIECGGSIKYCFADEVGIKENLFKEYFNYAQETSVGENEVEITWLSSTSTQTIRQGITASDGIFYGIRLADGDGNCDSLSNDWCADLMIDVNGPNNGQNRVGYDTFLLTLTVDEVLLRRYNDDSSDIRSNSCIQPTNTDWDQWYNAGWGCLKRIMEGKPKWSG